MMPISTHFDTGREFFSLAIALQNLLFGVFQPFVGMAADRWGAQRVIWTGAIAYALGLYLTSIALEPNWLFLTLGGLVGLGLSATSYVIVLGAVAVWYLRSTQLKPSASPLLPVHSVCLP
ncbi:probable MFS transporter [Photobacterium aphoticum]|uniref:Probable MFS transporter n=1 Tax=Photobacterium aphoticum TaxID=754436 RepID=A0A090QSQ5_9GAMM|nr:probable MFS transporter [Photobacterium aphoticum]